MHAQASTPPTGLAKYLFISTLILAIALAVISIRLTLLGNTDSENYFFAGYYGMASGITFTISQLAKYAQSEKPDFPFILAKCVGWLLTIGLFIPFCIQFILTIFRALTHFGS